jgi:hypothetical protein
LSGATTKLSGIGCKGSIGHRSGSGVRRRGSGSKRVWRIGSTWGLRGCIGAGLLSNAAVPRYTLSHGAGVGGATICVEMAAGMT